MIIGGRDAWGALPKDLRDLMAVAAERATGAMESAVAQDRDLTPVLEFWRHGQPTVAMAPTDVTRGGVLQVAMHVLVATGADRVVFVADTYQTTRPTNPDTGRPWTGGELCECAEVRGGLSSGIVFEGIVLGIAGPECGGMAILPYVRSGRTVRWADEMPRGTVALPADVAMMEALGEAFAMATGNDSLMNAMHDLFDRELGRTNQYAVADLAVSRFLADNGMIDCATLVAEPGSERAAVLGRHVAGMPDAALIQFVEASWN